MARYGKPRLAADRRRGMDDHGRDQRRHPRPARGRRRAADPQWRDQADNGIGEYPDIYRTFVDLIDERRSLVDVAPLRLVADCLLVGGRKVVEPSTADGATLADGHYRFVGPLS